MRFFKTFSILHRRTKSATFVSGPSLDPITPPNPRSSSQRSYNNLNDRPPSTVFDMATDNAASIPPHFNHLSMRLPSFWHFKRHGGRSSATDSTLLDRDHYRLKEGMEFWSSEHAKLQQVLNDCNAELMTARQKILTLEYRVEQDAQVIANLRGRLACQQKALGHTGRQSASSNHSVDTAVDYTFAASTRSQTLSALKTSVKAPTPEEYSNALRLTLATRKELRDQKKVSKFWKRRASLTDGQQNDLMTPSVSEISSLHEKIPADRQTALDNLIKQRGLSVVLSKIRSSTAAASIAEVVIQPEVSPYPLPSITSNMAAFDSKESFSFRLAPLASESFKVELHTMFGSRSSIKKPANLGHNLSESIISVNVSNSSSTFIAGRLANLSSEKGVAEICREGSEDMEVASLHGYLLEGLPYLTSSSQQLSALPSGTSETFSGQTKMPSALHPSIKQASKDCTSHRSWQHYTLNKPNFATKPATNVMSSLLKDKRKNAVADKENGALTSTLPVTMPRRRSRLPVPMSFFANNENHRSDYLD